MATAENTAEMPIGGQPPAEPTRLQQALQNITALSQRQKLAAAGAIALAIALIAAGGLMLAIF